MKICNHASHVQEQATSQRIIYRRLGLSSLKSLLAHRRNRQFTNVKPSSYSIWVTSIGWVRWLVRKKLSCVSPSNGNKFHCSVGWHWRCLMHFCLVCICTIHWFKSVLSVSKRSKAEKNKNESVGQVETRLPGQGQMRHLNASCTLYICLTHRQKKNVSDAWSTTQNRCQLMLLIC